MGSASEPVDLSPEGFTHRPDIDPSRYGPDGQKPAVQPTNKERDERNGICASQSGACMFSSEERSELKRMFQLRALAAELNFKLAVDNVKVKELMRKEEDVPWVVLMLIDVMSAHLSTALSNSFSAMRTAKLAELEAAASELAAKGAALSLSSRGIEPVLRAVSPEAGRSAIKGLTDSTKRSVGAAAKAPAEGKELNLDFLTQLQDEAGIAFENVREGLVPPRASRGGSSRDRREDSRSRSHSPQG